MTEGFRLVLRVLGGMVLGIMTVIIVIITALVLAFLNPGTVTFPGVITVWTGEENGAIALNFEPNPLGMLIVTLIIAVLYAVLTTIAARRRARQREA